MRKQADYRKHQSDRSWEETPLPHRDVICPPYPVKAILIGGRKIVSQRRAEFLDLVDLSAAEPRPLLEMKRGDGRNQHPRKCTTEERQPYRAHPVRHDRDASQPDHAEQRKHEYRVVDARQELENERRCQGERDTNGWSYGDEHYADDGRDGAGEPLQL